MALRDVDKETREIDKLLRRGFFESRADEYRRLFPEEFKEGNDDKLESQIEE